MDKQKWYIYTMDYYLVLRRKSCHLQQHGWMEGIILSETCQTKTNITRYSTYMQNLKKKSNSETESRKAVAGGGGNRERVIKGYKLLW